MLDQTLADGTYHFAYTTDSNGKMTQTDVTDPRGTSAGRPSTAAAIP